MITCAIYTSQPTTPMTPFEVLEILEVSQRNNQASGLSGVLFCTARTFLQVLEGPEAAVNATLERIFADPRHGAVKMLWQGVLDDRLFPGWYMRSVDSYEGARASFDSVGDEPLEPAEVHELILALGARPSARWLGDHPPPSVTRPT